MRIAYNLTKLHQSAGGSSWVTEYTYDKDNRPVTVKVNGKTITDSYNATGTRSSRVYGFATPYTVSFGYLAGANGSKTTMLQSYRNGSDAAYTYTYDNNGNVTAISQGTKSAAYTYDALNQLTRINDGFTNKTTTYTYDNAGNILERKEYAYTTGTLGTPTATFAYEYDGEWKDKLVSYNGETISYDEIGNPVSYRGYTMAWQGKRLESLSGNGLTASYTYDEQGIRSGKTINGVTASFSYNGSLLMVQVAPGKSLLFSYDANGQAISVNYNGTEYYYLRNGQNDIVGLMDESGVRVVEYIYDACGKLISTTGTLATTLGADNPFRYRGYYYDTETGFYYVSSRYYDPEIGRWINADNAIAGVGGDIRGYNLFAYCMNDPVNMSDHTGHWPQWIKNAASAVVNAVKKAVAVVANTVKSAVSSASNILKASSNSLPKKGEPGSSQTLPNPDGTPKQKRWYGPDGNPERDRDYNHPGNMPFPHDHEWKNGERGKEHLPPDPSYKMSWEPVIGAGLVFICTVGIIAVAADDLTGVGVADDFLFGPLGAGVGEGLIMIFG